MLLTLGGMYLSKLVLTFFFPDIFPAVELLDNMAVIVLTFGGNSIVFYIVALSIYIPTNSVQVFPFLDILSNSYF